MDFTTLVLFEAHQCKLSAVETCHSNDASDGKRKGEERDDPASSITCRL